MTDPEQDGDSLPPGLIEEISKALHAAIHNDNERLRASLHTIADVAFPAGLGYACYLWARTAASAILGSPQQLLEYNASGETGAGVQFMQDGRIVNTEDADPPTRFVGRMIACAYNDDTQAAITIWSTIDNEDLADCAVAMVRFTGAAISNRVLNDLGGAPGAVL